MKVVISKGTNKIKKMKKKNGRKNINVDRDKYVESIYHIVFFGNIVRSFNVAYSSVVDKINNDDRMIIRYSIQWNVMIITISLLDEINNFLFRYNNPLDVDSIKKIDSYKYMTEPILNEISKWPDLRKFRNNVLAHNFRIDTDDFRSVHLTNKLHSYNAPQSSLDLLTLFKYLDSITKIAGEVFVKEYQEALRSCLS